MGFAMNDILFKARLNLFCTLLDNELDGQRVVTSGYLSDAVKRHGAEFNLLDSDVERFVKHLETLYCTTQDDGFTLRNKFIEWYPQEKKNIDFHYWERLRTFWREKNILPREVVSSVDRVTDEIMGLLGNPLDKESWNKRRGLVMGHVQMGKTTNYSALVSKAADSGYRIIIILAGLTNSLRYQTQVRLDKTFVGKSSVSDATNSRIYDVVNVMKLSIPGYRPRYPFCGTTQLSDFNSATAGAVGAHQGTFAEPILFVTKKNPKVLQKITDWLRGLNDGAKLDGPMLVIDDEADNASINVNAETAQITSINEKIRLLLETCKQTTYVGYTATPFANIFINPDSTDEVLKEDLFPRDFIKSLDPPDNYVGSHRLFTAQGDLLSKCVREIPSDYFSLLPLKHKSKHEVKELPESLLDAIREYILFRAIRLVEGSGTAHSAMLINVSRFNYVQDQIKDIVDDFLSTLAKAIDSWALTEDWSKSAAVSELHRVWKIEYENVSHGRGIDWNQVRPQLLSAIKSIEPKLINMKGVGLDYEKAPSGGFHLIAIGGLALARGLTLEGLAISYALRNVGAADTLLQMGRWFGYRPGYEDLCRVHATQDLIDDFSSISESVEELRIDFQRMALLNKTPFDFGLKVRQSSTGIAITAANKMRSATPIVLAEDFSTRHVQAHSFHDNEIANLENMSVAQAFIKELSEKFHDKYENNNDHNALVWKAIPGSLVVEFIKKMSFPQTEFDLISNDGTSLLTSYIDDRITSELKEWDVAVPYIYRGDSNSVGFPIKLERNAFCISRGGTIRGSESVIKVNKKNAVAFGSENFSLGENKEDYEKSVTALLKEIKADGKEEGSPSITWARSVSRTRPLLFIHFIKLDPDVEKIKIKLPIDKPVSSLGILLPGTQIVCKEKKYQAGPRLLEMLTKLREEKVTDEELDDE
jgi:hypothetical protein